MGGCGSVSRALSMLGARDKAGGDGRQGVLSKDLFVLDGLIGEGGFGRVLTGLFVLRKKW